MSRLGDDRDAGGLVADVVRERHLLEVVDEHEGRLAGLVAHGGQHAGHLVGVGLLVGLVDVQAGGVLLHGEVGVAAVGDVRQRVGEPAPVGVLGLEDRAHRVHVARGGGVLPRLDGCRGRLERDEALDEGLRVVLEGEDDRVPPGPHGVAHHLQGHRRLAGALAAPEEDELAGAQPAVEGGVEQVEPGGPDLRAGPGPALQRLVGRLQQRRHGLAAVRGGAHAWGGLVLVLMEDSPPSGAAPCGGFGRSGVPGASPPAVTARCRRTWSRGTRRCPRSRPPGRSRTA